MTDGVPERGTVPQELQEFLLELAAAVNKYATYPAGHPSLAASAGGLVKRFTALTRTRGSVSLGVARRQLVVEGVPTDASHPLLRPLAERLHRQYLGALTITAGATEADVSALLALLGQEQEGPPLGLGDAARLRVAEHVRLFRLTYEQLQLLEEEGSSEADSAQLAQLWVGLARAALARAEGGELPEAEDPAAVARAINNHPVQAAFDQVIVGYLSQLARELRAEGSSTVVRRRLSRLVSELDADTLGRLVSMGGDLAQRRQFLLDAVDALSAHSVIDLARAAAHTSQETISSSMLRLLTKLSLYAESGMSGGERAGDELRAQVRQLVENWTLEDPNPDAYTTALTRMGTARRSVGGGAAAHPAEPLRLLQTALETDAAGPMLVRACDALVEAGQVNELVALAERAADAPRASAVVWQRLESGDAVRRLLAVEPIDFVTLDRVLRRVSLATAASLLLDRLAESQSMGTRMAILQRLRLLGDGVVPLVVKRLGDERWYVQRNLLSLLNELNAQPDVDALSFARSENASVRREAVLLGVRCGHRERALAMAFTDDDEQVIRVAVRAAQDGGIPAAVLPLALRVLQDPALPREVRLQLLRALRDVPDAAVRDALLALVAPGKTLLRRPRLAPKTPELVAALAVLAHGWRADPRVEPVLARARASGDAELAAAAGGAA